MIVSELAHRSGIAPHVVRYYALIGLLFPKRNPDNGYKVFNHDDLHRIHFIRKAQSLGFTLDEIQEIIASSNENKVPCSMVRDILARRIEENRYQITRLMEKQQRMEKAMKQWKTMPDQVCGSSSICHLIEAADDVPENA